MTNKINLSSISLVGDAHYYDKDMAMVADIRKFLASNHEKEKLRGMKMLTAVRSTSISIAGVVSSCATNVSANLFHAVTVPLFLCFSQCFARA